MIPVDQRIFDRVIGDCLTACVASILDLPYDQVPLFNKVAQERGCSWYHPVFEFLEPRGLEAYSVTPAQMDERWEGRWAGQRPRFAVACGKSPRGDWRHATVWEDGKGIVFDPHPSRAGIDGPITDFLVIVPREERP